MASPNTNRRADAHENNLYITPIEGLRAMEKFIPKGNRLYDPCAGLGDMANYFKGLNHFVFTSDLHSYGTELGVEIDFLKVNKNIMTAETDTIIINPPFTLTLEFVDKALELCDHVVMFNRMSVLEGQARGDKFTSKQWPLKHCDIFSYRVSCTKGVNREPTSNSVAYAVYEFDKRFLGNPTIGWITR